MAGCEKTGQLDMFGNEIAGDAEYQAFVEKFKPKKTTDDCYTPEPIYEAVAEWVAKEYGVDRARFVRPFWPGADYQKVIVPEGGTVVDNPPFSIITQITKYYLQHGVKFFLFAPTLTLFSGHERSACYIACGAEITYENGAKVSTSFVTNLDDYQLRSAPELYSAVKLANEMGKNTKNLPKYIYPDHVLTAAQAYQFSRYGIDFRVKADECAFIRVLDAQKTYGKSIFGSGLMLSDRAAADRAAADRAAAKIWQLSEREKALIKTLVPR